MFLAWKKLNRLDASMLLLSASLVAFCPPDHHGGIALEMVVLSVLVHQLGGFIGLHRRVPS
jgi:hypothetical protein